MDLAGLYRYLPAVEGRLRASYATERRAAPLTVRPYLDVNREVLAEGRQAVPCHPGAGRLLCRHRAGPRPAVGAAAALEHFQSWMLIHDDIIDHANERRGGPTVHRELEKTHRDDGRTGSSEEYGQGMGITLGDLEEPFTVEAILSSPAQPAARIAALEEYVGMTRQTAYGQLLDIRNGTLPPGTVTERDVLDVHRLKSAVYTVSSPLKIGALLGGSTPARLRDLEALAIDLGIAFQLRDDVLGAGFGSEDLGKSANDLIEGKRTLLVVRAWSEGSASDRAALEAVLGNPNAGDQDVENARKAIRSTGEPGVLGEADRGTDPPRAGTAREKPIHPGQRKAVADRGRGPVDAKNGLTGA